MPTEAEASPFYCGQKLADPSTAFATLTSLRMTVFWELLKKVFPQSLHKQITFCNLR